MSSNSSPSSAEAAATTSSSPSTTSPSASGSFTISTFSSATLPSTSPPSPSSSMEALDAREKQVRDETIGVQHKHQALLRSSGELQRKLDAVDKNRATITNRVADFAAQIAEANTVVAELAKRHRLISSKLEVLLESHRATVANREATSSELRDARTQYEQQVREMRELSTRMAKLDKKQDVLVVHLAQETDTKAKNEARLAEIRQHLALLKREEDAPEALQSQIAELEQKQAYIEANQDQRTANIASMETRVRAVAGECEQIRGMLPALKSASAELERLTAKLQKNEVELEKQARRIGSEASSWSSRQSKVSEALNKAQAKVGRMRQHQNTLMAELTVLDERKMQLETRLADVTAAEQTLAARVQDHLALLTKLRRSRIELRRKMMRSNAADASPSAGRSRAQSVMPGRPVMGGGSSTAELGARGQPVTIKVMHAVDQDATKLVPGTLTVTSYLVIYESESHVRDDPAYSSHGEDTFKLCVDVQDIASARLIDSVTFEDAGHESTGNPVQLEIGFRPHFKNRFLFNESTRSRGNASVFENTVRFRGDEELLRKSYRALHNAILYHERLTHHEDTKPKTPSRRPRSDSAPDAASAGMSERPRASSSGSTGAISDTASNAAPAIAEPRFDVEGVSRILNAQQMEQVLAHTPRRYHMETWRRYFFMAEDGTSLKNFLRLAGTPDVSLLLLQDSEGACFGAFAAKKWHEQPLYYGTGESFVFKVDGESGEVRNFHWTGANDFVQMSDSKCIAFGGGGHFAIHLDSRLENGSSGPCSTFDSPILAGKPDFILHRFEVWGPETFD